MNDRSFALRARLPRAASLLMVSVALSACGDSHEVNPADYDAESNAIYDDEYDNQRDASRALPSLGLDGGLGDLAGLFGDLFNGTGGRRDAGAANRDAGARDAGARDASVADASLEAGVGDAGAINALCRSYPRLPFCPRDAGLSDASLQEAGAGDAGTDGGLEAGAGDAGDAGTDAGDAAADAGDATLN